MKLVRAAQCVLLALVLWQWGGAGWIYLKAQLAQYLIAEAWSSTLITGERVKPWSWADTWPVARLQVPAQNIDLFVLAGAQGNSLAFAPGQEVSTNRPGYGASVIGGHRDTHFAFLQHLAIDSEIKVQRMDGVWVNYRTTGFRVADIRKQPLNIDPLLDELWLVTCYPFNGLEAGGPLRFVIKARRCERGCSEKESEHSSRV